MKTYWVWAGAALMLAGCVVGPNFKKPAPPEVSDYTPVRSEERRVGKEC